MATTLRIYESTISELEDIRHVLRMNGFSCDIVGYTMKINKEQTLTEEDRMYIFNALKQEAIRLKNEEYSPNEIFDILKEYTHHIKTIDTSSVIHAMYEAGLEI